MNMYIVVWQGRGNGLCNGVMPGVFLDRAMAGHVANILEARDTSRVFHVMQLPLIESESVADSWIAPRPQGREAKRTN